MGSYAGRDQPGSAALGRWIERRWRVRSDGYYPRPLLHGQGLAQDVMTNANMALGREIFAYFSGRMQQLGIQELIFNRKIITLSRLGEGVRDYGPSNVQGAPYSPHDDHVHIGLTVQAGQQLTEAMLEASARGEAVTVPLGGLPTGTPSGAPGPDLSGINRAATVFGSRSTWERAGKVVLGGALALGGVYLVSNDMLNDTLGGLAGKVLKR